MPGFVETSQSLSNIPVLFAAALALLLIGVLLVKLPKTAPATQSTYHVRKAKRARQLRLVGKSFSVIGALGIVALAVLQFTI